MYKSICFPYGITMQESGNLAIFPAATVILQMKNGDELPLVMLIDSGATVSAMPKNVAALLGIDYKDGEHLNIYGIGGKHIRAWQHNVSVRIGANTIQLPIAFMDNNNAPRVLGRKGIFDAYTVVFEEKNRRSAFVNTVTTEAQAIEKTLSKIPRIT